MDSRTQVQSSSLPLCVDLDGTLVNSDLLVESVLGALRKSPWTLLKLPAWIMRGKSHAKEQLATRAAPDITVLPYNTDVVDLARTARDEGRRVILVTGSHRIFAEQVAAHLGLFDEVFATTAERNLTGTAKAEMLEQLLGRGQFEYVGNGSVDLPIWRVAAAATTVNAPSRVVRKVASLGKPHRDLPRSGVSVGTWLRAIRLRQWVKNALLFVPIITSHKILSFDAIAPGLLAFVCFGMLASATYIINDLFDLDADRHHHKKRHRPFAAGLIEAKQGLICAALLLGTGLALSLALPLGFQLSMLAYLITTVLYSFSLKRIASLDVIILAGLYTLRIIAGAFAVGVPLSFWLLAFSMFIFLSLALVKRVAELIEVRKSEELNARIPGKLRGREYATEDVAVLQNLGASSGYLAVLVLALYIQSPEVSDLYRSPEILWLIAPLLLLWVTRLWVITARGYMDEDPIYYAVKDPETWITAAVTGGILLAATFLVI